MTWTNGGPELTTLYHQLNYLGSYSSPWLYEAFLHNASFKGALAPYQSNIGIVMRSKLLRPLSLRCGRRHKA